MLLVLFPLKAAYWIHDNTFGEHSAICASMAHWIDSSQQDPIFRLIPTQRMFDDSDFASCKEPFVCICIPFIPMALVYIWPRDGGKVVKPQYQATQMPHVSLPSSRFYLISDEAWNWFSWLSVKEVRLRGPISRHKVAFLVQSAIH